MSTQNSSANCTDTIHAFAADPVVRMALDEYTSWCRTVEEAFRCDVIPDYPRSAKHCLISMFLEEKRIVAKLIRDKAKLMSGGDRTSCFWGAYLYWDDALSVIKWLNTQVNHAKLR